MGTEVDETHRHAVFKHAQKLSMPNTEKTNRPPNTQMLRHTDT